MQNTSRSLLAWWFKAPCLLPQSYLPFKDIVTGEITHTTILDAAGAADYRSVIAWFAQGLMKELRLEYRRVPPRAAMTRSTANSRRLCGRSCSTVLWNWKTPTPCATSRSRPSSGC